MKPLAMGIVEDLRRRRLLPVAVLLLVALVALPVLMLKSAPAAPAPEPAPAANAAQTGGLPSPEDALDTDKPLVTLAVLEQASNLDEYSQKDPFKPLETVRSSGTASSPLAAAQEASASSGSSASGGSSSGGSSGGSSTGSNQTTSTGGNTQTTPQQTTTTTPKSQTETTEKTLTYALDATLEGPIKTVSYRSLPKLTAIPTAANPLLIFLGIDSTGKNAVFLVDASLKVLGGEGACSPSKDACGTLKLQPGQVEIFQDAAGKQYTLGIDQIREVSVASASRATERRDKQARDSARASNRPTRRFMPPVITDLFVRSTR